MKATNNKLAIRVLALAVQGALAAMAAMPLAAHAQSDEGDDVASLTNPTNNVEVGIANASKASTKFGEYNGMNKDGAYLIGNVNAKGGDSYGMNTGTKRWSITATDLGTTSREVDASVGSQGAWQVGVGYDQLRHYTTTNFQTPYSGSMGGNNFALPANFGSVNTGQSATGASGGATLVGGRSLNATQLGDFNTQDVYTQRENTKFSLGFDFNQNWNFRFDFNHLDQSGAKLIGSGTDPFATSGSFGGIAFGSWKGEVPVILMNPTNYKTETATAAFNWSGDNAFATVGYFGSVFHDAYSGITWSNPFETAGQTGTILAAGLPTSTMSTPPSNQFHQLNMTGGYNFSQATHLTGGVSYGRNTQNQSYDGTYTPGYVTNLPGNSLNALVVMKHADVKLSNKTTNDLTLSGALKFDERNNKTASNLYTYYDEGNKLREAWNTPMSNKKTQFDLAGDYRINANQKLRLGYQHEKIERWCDSSPSLAQITSAYSFTGTTFNTAALKNAAALYYTGGNSCVQVPESTENRVTADYRVKATDSVTLNAGVATGKRAATINTAFYNPMQSVTEGFENPGFVAFFDASRKENLFKAGVNWQATDQLTMGVSGKYRKDTYTDEKFGVGDGKVSSVNLDAAYSYSDTSTVSAFATWQWRSRDLNTEAGRIPVASGIPASPYSNQNWTNSLTDNDITFGINGKQKGLMGNRLELNEDLSYSLAKTDYTTNVGYATTGCVGSISTATSNQACGSPPTIKSDTLRLKVSGKYMVDKASSVTVGYLYQRLKSDDYYYNAYQYPNGFTSGLPTNQQAPNYTQNVIFASYNYSFK